MCSWGNLTSTKPCSDPYWEPKLEHVSVTPLTNGNGSWYHIGNARHAWDGWCNEESLCIRNCSGPSAGLLHISASSKLGSKAETKLKCLQEWYWRMLTRLMSKTFLKYPPIFFCCFVFHLLNSLIILITWPFFVGGIKLLVWSLFFMIRPSPSLVAPYWKCRE